MSPTTTPLRPASASTPLAIISTRIHAARRLPQKTGATNIESGKKISQPRMSRAYTTEGQLNDRTSGSHDYPVDSGWRLKVKMQKCTLHVTPARKPIRQRRSDRVSWCASAPKRALPP
jgi:hypothetical protein